VDGLLIPAVLAPGGESPDEVVDAENQPGRPENALEATCKRGLASAGAAVEDDRFDTHPFRLLLKPSDGLEPPTPLPCGLEPWRREGDKCLQSSAA
jgi:hypothetical protein